MATGKPFRVPKRIMQETAQSGLFCLDMRLVAVILQNFKRLYWDASWIDANGRRAPLSQAERDTIAQWEYQLMSNLTDCLGDELGDILNQINQIQTTQNQHTSLLNLILEETMTTINFSPVITQNCGCGGGSGGGSNPIDPDPTTDPTIEPPPPSDDLISQDEPYRSEWLCPASIVASENLTQFVQNARNMWSVSEDFANYLTGMVASLPTLSAFVAPIALFSSSVNAFGGFYPFDQLMTMLQETEQERACILYTAESAQMADMAYRDFIFDQLTTRHGYTEGSAIYASFYPVLSLLDYEAVYTEGSYSVDGIIADCSSCGGTQNGGDLIHDVTDWPSLALCLEAVDFTHSISNGSVYENNGKTTFEFNNAGNGVIATDKPQNETIKGIAFVVSDINSFVPQIGGNGGVVSMVTGTVSAGSGVVIFCTDDIYIKLYF